MSLPPLPKKQKFPDPDKHIAKKELHKEIRATIQNLFKRMNAQFPIESEGALRFAAFIYPGFNADVSRLPTVATKPTAPKPNRASCLFHRLSWLIQLHWKWLQEESPEIEKEIKNVIEYLNELDYGNAKITGNDREGYELR